MSNAGIPTPIYHARNVAVVFFLLSNVLLLVMPWYVAEARYKTFLMFDLVGYHQSLVKEA
jgi:hypothetical protein